LSIAALVQTPSSFINNAYIIESVGNSPLYVNGGTARVVSEFSQISGDPFVTYSSLSASTWYRIFVIWDTTQVLPQDRQKLYINNIDVTNYGGNAGSGSLPAAITYIGDQHNNNTSWVGYIGEIVLTNAAFTLTDRNNLDSYWTTKWAI
jgi:hypothetical protein